MSSSGFRRTRPKKSTVPSSTPKTVRSSAYDDNFERHLGENGVYIERRGLPNNRSISRPDLRELHHKLTARRSSLSPSQFTTPEFEEFQHTADQTIDEGGVMRAVVPIICGRSYNIPNEQNLLFNKLEPITNAIVDAKPDFYDGVCVDDVNKVVCKDLGHVIIPTGYTLAPIAPNFFLEVKGPKGGTDVAKRQACYNGALGARAMHCLQNFGQDSVFDGKPYTITTTYHAGQLNMYASHPAIGPGGSFEFHMTQVNSWSLIGNPEHFRQGVTAFRNARDWTQKQRNSLISAANERATSMAEQLSLLPPGQNKGLNPRE